MFRRLPAVLGCVQIHDFGFFGHGFAAGPGTGDGDAVDIGAVRTAADIGSGDLMS